MNKKGTALIVTLVYMLISAVICAAVLTFSAQHYTVISHMINKAKNLYLSDGGLFMGLYGTRGNITIDSKTVNISEEGANLKAARNY